MKTHIATMHDGKKPYECHTCGKAFTQKVHLMGHVAAKHNKVPLNCTHCPRTFKGQYTLDRHVALAHEGQNHVANGTKDFNEQQLAQDIKSEPVDHADQMTSQEDSSFINDLDTFAVKEEPLDPPSL